MKTKKMLFSLLSLGASLLGFGQDTIRLKPYIENMKTIEVVIEGKRYNFLFDTGGAETIISPEIATHFNKKIYGRATGFRMSGEMIKTQKSDGISMTIGSTKIFHPAVGVFDIMSILPKEFPKLDGVISLKTFVDHILTLNLSKNTIIVESKSSSQKTIRGKSLVASRFANGLDATELNIFLNIPKDNQSYWFLFDSGNSGPLLLSTETAATWKLSKDKDNMNSETQFVIGEKVLISKSFTRDIIYDGVLNFETLCNYIFTIDFKNSKVWIK
ncbi:MAG: retropepsin-like aspartic protease [Chryseobacterium jejuense]|uniref:retropepsin-like aspartic protease n=1 Tax=Chryseobacterium jejuense TaxID=445960 RepID=UPI003D09D558